MKNLIVFALAAAVVLARIGPIGASPGKDKGELRDPILEALLKGSRAKRGGAIGKGPVIILDSGAGKFGKVLEKPDSDKPDPKLARLLERMDEARKKVNKLTCEIVKTRLTPLISDKPDRYTGSLKFRTPRYLWMELKGPARAKKEDQRTTRTIVTKEYAFVWRVEDNEAERFRLPQMEDKKISERNPFEFGLAADLRNLKRGYYLTLLGQEKLDGRKTQKIRARPRPHIKDPPYVRLVFWIDDDQLMPVQFQQVKSQGEIVDTYRLRKLDLKPWWLVSPFKAPPARVNLIRHDLAKKRK